MRLARLHAFGRNVTVSVFFEPRDLWVGVYWNRLPMGTLDVYVCIVPCLPIYFIVGRPV